MTISRTTRSQYLASHLLLDQLAAEGTRFIFGSLAAADSPVITAALETRTDINYLAALHEQIAGSMAMGYAQASGRPGVVSLPAATGLINGLSSLYNAMHVRVPMVVLADQQDSQIVNDEPPLSGNLCQLAAPVTKRTFELKSPSEIPRLVRRAFHEALTPPRGPVFVSMPVDILLGAAEQNSIPPPSSSPMGAADSAFLRKAAKTLVDAQRPCMIVGNEVSLFRARREAVTLAEVIGCPVFSEPLPTGVNFPNRHPHYAGVLPLNLNQASAKLCGFDVILVLGMQTRMPARIDEPDLIPRNAQVIQINIEPGLAGKTLPCSVTANADIAESLSRLRAEIQLIVNSGWVNAAKQRAHQTITEIANNRQEMEDQIVYPSADAAIPLVWLLRLLDASRPRTSIVVNDLVSASADPLDILNLESSASYFGSNGGIAGHGMAAALGVQWATPESPVVCITSDSSTLYYPQVLWTASHYGLHVKFLVVNTLGRSTFNLRLAQIPLSEGRMVLDNPTISLPEMARSMRVQGTTVTTMNSLEPALHKMFETPGPFLLDVHVGEDAR